jgi:ParB family transcriptional regulator, chromosome partitioning protein
MAKKLNFKEIALSAVSPKRPSGAAHPISQLAANEGFLYIPLRMVRSDPDQPRKYFNDASLDDLTASIREKGVLQPILVRKEPAGEGFVIIAGERRWRAAKAVGLKEIPALVRDAQDALEVALIENVQRENLKPLEEAEALMRLKQARDFTDQALAKIIGKSRTSVTELLTLNQLPKSIKDECRTSDIWTRSQLLQLVRAGSPKEIEVVWARIKGGSGATVRDLRRSSGSSGRKRAGGRYKFLHKPKGRTFQVLVTFSKAKATRSEVGAALKDALKHLP